MSSIPVPEYVYVDKYGALPDREERERIEIEWNDLFSRDFRTLHWVDYWLESDPNVDLLERLYIFWDDARKAVEPVDYEQAAYDERQERIRRSRVERAQARASSDD